MTTRSRHDALPVCWCPVAATSAWVDAADLHEGPLFRAVDQWAGIATTPLHSNSLVRLLRRIFREAGLASPDDYSSHSLRRGFAGWAKDRKSVVLGKSVSVRVALGGPSIIKNTHIQNRHINIAVLILCHIK